MQNYGAGKVVAMNNGETIAIKVGESYFDISLNGEVKGEIEVTLDSTPGIIEGQGTAEEPFVIMSIEDLVWFSRQVNGYKDENNKDVAGVNYANQYVELGKTLDFNSDLSYVNPNTTEYDTYLGGNGTKGLKEQLTKGLGFKPIGTGLNTSFRGNFNGNNYTIKNIKIDVLGNAGLFGYVFGGTYKNLVLKGEVRGTAQVGSLIGELLTIHTEQNRTGWDFRTIIENIKNECVITNNGTAAYQHAGGIVGKIGSNYNTPFCIIKDCYNSGDIKRIDSWHSGVGGIVGHATGGTLYSINNWNSGDVETVDGAAHAGAGGILGSTTPGTIPPEVNIYNCYNTGEIKGKKCGGLVGKVTPTSLNIYNSYNFVDMPNVNASIAFVIENGNVILEDVYYASDSEKYINNSWNNTIVVDNVRKLTLTEAKSSTFVDELNANIQNGYSYKQTNSEGVEETIKVDTIGWAKWVYNSGGYPTLDTSTTWNGTSWPN